MKPDQATLKMWEQLKEYGDVNAIAAELGVSVATISVAINGGDCTSENIIGINNYYSKKRKLIEDSKKGLK